MSSIQFANGIAVRHARSNDIPSLRTMQINSLVLLGAPFYTPAEISGFIDLAGTMDDAVIDEGHYFVAMAHSGAIVASGGWSVGTPGYDRARVMGAIDQAQTGTGIVRSVFVDPAVARCGMASALMAHVERDAAQAGICILRLMATLSGLGFYRRLGWRAEGEKAIALPGGLQFRCMSMSKSIAPCCPFI
jgi:GNAT superfamily N-acetyltransferase